MFGEVCLVRLRRLTWRERLLLLLFPARRRKHAERLRAGICWLCEHPEVVVYIE